MLFHIKQTHAPQDCPYGKGGSRTLFDAESTDVKIHGAWLAFPEHTLYFIVETDDIVHLQQFLQPGAGKAVAEIIFSMRPPHFLHFVGGLSENF